MKERILSDLHDIWVNRKYGGAAVLSAGFLAGVVLAACLG